MHERFTDRARTVIQLANQEAQRFNHEYIGTEHILLGLVLEGSGLAAKALKNLAVDLRRIRYELERIVQPGMGGDEIPVRRLPQTPRAKKVIEFAIEEARNLNHNYIGSEHLLLGLLREGEGVAAQVLLNLGLKLDDVRAEILRLVGEPVLRDQSETVHRIDAVLVPPSAPLPMEFAVLDQVIARFSSVYDRAVQTRRPVEAEWFAEQIASLRQVRELILSRFGDQTPPTAGP